MSFELRQNDVSQTNRNPLFAQQEYALRQESIGDCRYDSPASISDQSSEINYA